MNNYSKPHFDFGELPVCGGNLVRVSPQVKVQIDYGIPEFDHVPPCYAGNENIIAMNRKIKIERIKKTERR